MANKLSDLGKSIFVDGYDGETILPLKADGTSKAGWLVGQTAGDGTARGINPTGNLDELDGIQMERYDTDLDSAPTAAKAISVVRPKAGRRYRVHVYLGAAAYSGEPMVSGVAGQAGCMGVAGDVEVARHGRLSKNAANADDYAEVLWGA